MEQSTRSRGSAGGNGLHSLTKQMALEAADMEARLASLRAAMAKEKTKREAALNPAGAGGSIWNHGAVGTLRSKGAQPLQQPASARTVGSSSSSGNRISVPAGTTGNSSRVGSAARPGPSAAHGATKATTKANSSSRPSSQAGAALQDKPAVYRPRSGAAAATIAQAPQLLPAAAAVAATSRSQPSKPTPRGTSAQGYAATVDNSSIGGVSNTRSSSSSGAQSSEGIGTGGADDSLLGGAYDEGASHNSFLEALNEWRQAGKTNTSSTGEAGSQLAQPPGKAPAMSAMDVQTDTRAPGSWPNSYSSSTGTAGSKDVGTLGNAVGGSYFLKMLARSSNGRTAQDVAALDPVSLVRQASPQDCQQHDQQQQGGKSGSIVAASVIEPTAETAQFAEQAADDTTEGDESGSGDEALPGFDAWLEVAEQHAEQAVTSSTRGTRADPNIETAATGDRHPGLAGYELEMQQVLQRLEHLEDRQRAVIGATSTADRPQALVQQEAGRRSSGVVYFTAGMRLPDAIRLPVS